MILKLLCICYVHSTVLMLFVIIFIVIIDIIVQTMTILVTVCCIFQVGETRE